MENYKRIDSIQIGLASPKQIRRWAERKLPTGRIVGQVTNPQTVNYKTLRPEPGGLFCEKIFGPVKDYECACGKKRNLVSQKYCNECEVDYVSSRVRRYRLGFIQLASPVAHIWYLKGTPSYLSILLDMPRKKVESIVYCTESISLNDHNFLRSFNFFENDPMTSLIASDIVPSGTTMIDEASTPGINIRSIKASSDNTKSKNILSLFGLSKRFVWESQEEEGLFRYYSTATSVSNDIPVSAYSFLPNIKFTNSYLDQPLTGAEAILNLLKTIDLAGLERQISHEVFELQEEIEDIESRIDFLSFEEKRLQFLIVRRTRMLKRLKLIRQFRRTKTRPEWMIVSVLPVLPPDLRPIVQLDGDQVAVSDLNKLYQKVIFRNNRMKRHQRSHNLMNQSDELKYAQRLLQEAVDSLIENGKGGADPVTASNERPLKSLSDMLKGKKGRFRQNLLGKRVDYSGRSVIVVGPHLQLHECGIPREMAIELFQPFLIHNLISTNVVRTILGAKHLIQKKDPKVWKSLEHVMRDHPVLLNRAPTLHRLGIQAFQPKLVTGRAIHLHPLVCPAFNADFDGDQMAVHVPLSYEARAEAWTLMWARNNLLSPATGQPILVPSQDMVLGCFYLTTMIPEKKLSDTTLDLPKATIPKNFYSNVHEILFLYARGKLHAQSTVWVRLVELIENDQSDQHLLEIQLTASGQSIHIYSDRLEIYSPIGNFIGRYIRTTPGRIFLNDAIHRSLKNNCTTV